MAHGLHVTKRQVAVVIFGLRRHRTFCRASSAMLKASSNCAELSGVRVPVRGGLVVVRVGFFDGSFIVVPALPSAPPPAPLPVEPVPCCASTSVPASNVKIVANKMRKEIE